MLEPNSRKDRRNRRIAWVALHVIRFFLRLPDRFAVLLLGGLIRLFRRINGEDPLPLIEIRDIVRDDPQGREAFRRMAFEGRDEQIVSALQGMLRHHAKPPTDPKAAYATVRAVSRPAMKGAARIAVAGNGPNQAALREVYAARAGVTLVEAVAEADAIEIALGDETDVAAARAALLRGAVVSLHLGDAATAEAVADLLAVARVHGTPLRVFEPTFHFRPAQRMKELVATGAVGEPTTVRVRATLGRGGRRALDPPFGERPLRHPAFDQFLSLAFWGGGVARATAYLKPFEATGGQALVSVQFQAPGRYGLLECAYAPDLYIRSESFPHDYEVEITGTDGFVRLRRGMADRTQEAPITLRVGQTARTIGVECGLVPDWSEVYRCGADELLATIGGKAIAHLPEGDVLTALRLRDRVHDLAADPYVAEL